MNRNLKLFLLSMALPVAAFAQEQTINLSTGVSNANNTLLAMGAFDDTWTHFVNGNNFPLLRTCSHPDWEESGCSRWISLSSQNGIASPIGPGAYTFNARFTVSPQPVNCATLYINEIGADNTITGLRINGHLYPLSLPAGNDHFSSLTSNIVLTINPAHLIAGSNNNNVTLEINNVNAYSGINVCAEVKINEEFRLTPELNGPTTICQGSPLTFFGGLIPGGDEVTHHLWKLLECDAAGNIVANGFSWEQWYTGTPGTFTFPSNLNLTCGKYYMAVLSVVHESGCSNWGQDLQVFYYACKPVANAGPDKLICQDECVSIGAGVAMKWTSYNWTADGSSVGTGVSISVCPQATTTYTLTATNQYGCTATDQVVVTLLPNNPRFNIATDVSNSNYYTVTGTPVVMNANNVSGFGAYWSVEELDATGNSLYVIQNPTVWYPYPASLYFKGFDDYALNYDATPNVMDVINSLPTTPTVGRFVYNKTYRITRGTWNDNCDWNASSYSLTATKSANGNQVYVYETEAPDFSEQAMAEFATLVELKANEWKIAPNPSNGVFNLSSENGMRTVVEVVDLLGNKIQTHVIEAGTTSFAIDLSGFAKGIYVVNITSGDVTSTHKVILE